MVTFPPGFDVNESVSESCFVDAAYTAFQKAQATHPPSLTPAVTPPAGYTSVAWIQMTDTFLIKVPEFYGYIAKNNADPTEHAVVFRGTSNALEWIDNAWCTLIPCTLMPGAGRTHEGFSTIYGSIKIVVDSASGADATPPTGTFAEQVATAIIRSSTVDGVAPTKIRLLSHSLGGALMTLYVVDNQAKGSLPKATVNYTFASPRVGDATFVAKYNSLGLQTWRIANAPDLVPQVPLESMGYEHVNTAVDIDSTGLVAYSPTCAHLLPGYRAALLQQRIATGDCAMRPADDAMAATRGS